MSATPQPQVPPPPRGSASWIDYVLDMDLPPVAGDLLHARAELAALRKERDDLLNEGVLTANDLRDATKLVLSLRKELADTKAQLKQQVDNTLEALKQRDAALVLRDEALAQARYAADFHDEVCEPTAKERDELRTAVLALGELTGTVTVSQVVAWNALVAKLRGEKEGQ